MCSPAGARRSWREEGGSGGHRLIVLEDKCRVTTTDGEGTEVMPADLVEMDPQWVPSKNRTEAPPG